MKTFEQAFKQQLEDKPKKTPKEKRLLKALNDPTPGPLKRRRLNQMKLAEDHAKVAMGFEADEKVDWEKVSAPDWAAVLDKLIDFIAKLLALFA
jgi:hypothetical protein